MRITPVDTNGVFNALPKDLIGFACSYHDLYSNCTRDTYGMFNAQDWEEFLVFGHNKLAQMVTFQTNRRPSDPIAHSPPELPLVNQSFSSVSNLMHLLGSYYKPTTMVSRCWFIVADNAEERSYIKPQPRPAVTVLGSPFFANGGTIGCDPEFFAVDSKNQLIPAWRCFPSKCLADKEAVAEGYLSDGHTAPYWDGFQGEFNTLKSTCLETLHWSVTKALYATMKILVNSAQRVTPKPTFYVPQTELKLCDEQYIKLGCKPSLSAYGQPPLPEDLDPFKVSIRSAGFHFHFGHPFLTLCDPSVLDTIVTLMDVIGGITSVAIFAGIDDPRRRQYYGKAGEYRRPKHGLEYRVLSSAIFSHPTYFYLFGELLRFAIDIVLQDIDYTEIRLPRNEIQSIINTNDVGKANIFVKKRMIPFMKKYLHRLPASGLKSATWLCTHPAKDWCPSNKLHEDWSMPESQLAFERGAVPETKVSWKLKLFDAAHRITKAKGAS